MGLRGLDIAFFTFEYYPNLVGGLGRYSMEITKGLRKRGNYINVFTINKNENNVLNTLPTYQDINSITVHRPKLIRMDDILFMLSDELRNWGEGIRMFDEVFSYNILSFSKFLNKTLVEENVDVVSINDWLSSIAGILIKKHTSLPVVFHIHSTEELRSNLSNLIKSFEHKLGKECDKIITVSYSMKDHLISLGYDENNIEVVWNGVDVNKYCRENVDPVLLERLRKNYDIDNEKVVLFVGRLTKIKGVENLVRSFYALSKNMEDVKLVILGRGEEEGHIRNLISTLNLKDKVTVRNEWVSEEELIAHYGMADLCVFPSFSEPFGIVGIESLSMKVPFLGSNVEVSGFKEILQDMEELLINPYDVEEIATKMYDLLNDENKLKEYGEKGRDIVLKNFTVDKMVEKTLKVYEEVIP